MPFTPDRKTKNTICNLVEKLLAQPWAERLWIASEVDKERDEHGNFIQIKRGSKARLWSPCSHYLSPMDESKAKLCRRCGRTDSAHWEQGLPLSFDRLCMLARKRAELNWLEWRRLDNRSRAEIIAEYRVNVLVEAFNREAAAGAESGFTLKPLEVRKDRPTGGPKAC